MELKRKVIGLFVDGVLFDGFEKGFDKNANKLFAGKYDYVQMLPGALDSVKLLIEKGWEVHLLVCTFKRDLPYWRAVTKWAKHNGFFGEGLLKPKQIHCMTYAALPRYAKRLKFIKVYMTFPEQHYCFTLHGFSQIPSHPFGQISPAGCLKDHVAFQKMVYSNEDFEARAALVDGDKFWDEAV